MSVNGMVTTVLSDSLLHVMFGVGLPSARHFRVAFPPSVTVWFLEVPVMTDETAKKQGYI